MFLQGGVNQKLQKLALPHFRCSASTEAVAIPSIGMKEPLKKARLRKGTALGGSSEPQQARAKRLLHRKERGSFLFSKKGKSITVHPSKT